MSGKGKMKRGNPPQMDQMPPVMVLVKKTTLLPNKLVITEFQPAHPEDQYLFDHFCTGVLKNATDYIQESNIQHLTVIASVHGLGIAVQQEKSHGQPN